MALKEFQIIASIKDITATGDIIKFRIPFTGEIKKIDLWTDTANSAGDNVINLNVAGSDLYSGSGRPKIAASATHGQKTGLSDAVTFGDEAILQLESMATGGIAKDLVLQITFDDGVSSGSGGGAYGADIPPSSPPTENDEFDATSLDSKWSETGTGDTQPSPNLTTIPSYLLLKYPTTGSGVSTKTFEQVFVPGSADFSITAKAGVGNLISAEQLYIRLSDSIEDNLLLFGFWYSSGKQTRVVRLGSSNSFAQFNVAKPSNAKADWLHVQRVSGAYSFYHSADGIFWEDVTLNMSMTITVTKLQIFCYHGAGISNEFGLDSIRRDWMFL